MTNGFPGSYTVTGRRFAHTWPEPVRHFLLQLGIWRALTPNPLPEYRARGLRGFFLRVLCVFAVTFIWIVQTLVGA
jgi:hypothetical protein